MQHNKIEVFLHLHILQSIHMEQSVAIIIVKS